MDKIPYHSPFGVLYLVLNDGLLHGIEMETIPRCKSKIKIPNKEVHPAVAYLNAYFNETPYVPDPVYFDWRRVTVFQAKIIQSLMLIPFGEVKTYSQLSYTHGSVHLRRAVGGALRANPFPLIYPCHRVIGQQEMGGYSGNTASGRMWKQSLLVFENPEFEFLPVKKAKTSTRR